MVKTKKRKQKKTFLTRKQRKNMGLLKLPSVRVWVLLDCGCFIRNFPGRLELSVAGKDAKFMAGLHEGQFRAGEQGALMFRSGMEQF